MTRSWAAWLALFHGGCLAGVGETTAVVDVDAVPSVGAVTQLVEVMVISLPERRVAYRDRVPIDRDRDWPMRLVLVPDGSDPNESFYVTWTALAGLDVDAEPVAVQALLGTFAEGETVTYRVLLEEHEP